MAATDAALTELPPAAPADAAAQPRLPVLRQRWEQSSQRQKAGAIAAAALAVAVLVAVLLWTRAPDYAVLFSNIDDKDGGAIVAVLGQQNVPYKFSDNGHAIMVPSGQVHDLRLRLAAQGLPRGGSVGFELLDTQKFGLSEPIEQMNIQRALEGELARTIQSLEAVSAARVHLAIPKQKGFLREEQKPSASVVVNLNRRSLSDAQVAGIVHLVASSVPQLDNESVVVIDQNGKLLTKKADPQHGTGLDPKQLEYVREVEQDYVKRIEAILLPVVGKGNVRAQATADIDFNLSEQTAETFKPNPNPDSAVRSEQSSETITNQQGPAGVPGALSNQPPPVATAPVTTNATPGQTGTNAANTQPITTKKEALRNYEVDKTVSHVRRALGQVRRLSVAVVVNHRGEKQKDGSMKPVALADAEMKQINDLVREAVGFNKDRGDTVAVANTPFTEIEAPAEAQLPLWKDPENIALGKELLKYLLLAGVVAYLLLGVVRPVVKSLTTPPEEEKKPEDEDMEVRDLTPAEGEEEATEVELSPEEQARLAYEQKLTQIRQLAQSNPKLVAEVLREWVGANE
ncbi:MAG: flagellar M-ring protein FliF [Rhodocyclaceae bacterium]|nr:flagellar M-ring protein FliF [Rhodocyclaceae bacterium]MBX3668638.1 flagellar M-ring protein FliF [Rhodocyclaceae bacterium]